MLAAVALAALSVVHLPATTADPAAQALLDRGLLFYYAYDGGDAAQLFAQAAARDPHLAMAYWGIALAAGPDLNTPMTPDGFARGHEAISLATKLEANLPSAERAYVDAMSLRYRGTWADWASNQTAYRTAMLRLADSSHDTNAALLAAEALLEDGGLDWNGDRLADARSQHAHQIVDAVLEADPGNVMANHLCIHIYDRAPQRDPARLCAMRLDAGTYAPQAEHLAHMPAHYWIETGDYAAAVASSERAYQLFTQLQAIATRNPEHDRYLLHDLYVGYSATMMLGGYALARRWSARLVQANGPAFAGLTALRFGRYADAYARAADTSPSDVAVRAYAALQMGRFDEAHRLSDSLRKLKSAGYLADLFLARLAESDGHFDEAQRRLESAATEQKQSFAAEYIPLLPALEARGGLALRRNAFADAVTAFTRSLDAYPQDPRALFGLSLALAGLGRTQDAMAARDRFEHLWAGADTTLTPADL